MAAGARLGDRGRQPSVALRGHQGRRQSWGSPMERGGPRELPPPRCCPLPCQTPPVWAQSTPGTPLEHPILRGFTALRVPPATPHLRCPLGGHPRPHEGLGGTGWHKSPLAAARSRARHNSSRCPRMLLITLLINPAPNERPRHTGSFLIAARPPAAAAGAVIKALTSCGSTSGRALPARLGCFICFFFSPVMEQKENSQR